MEQFDLVVFDDYERNGEIKSRPYSVGSAFRNQKAGFSLVIPAGVALSGRVQMLPRREADRPDAQA